LRLAELIGHLFPPGAFNVVAGDRESGARLVSHPGVAMIAVTGSVPTGKAIMRSAADSLKPVLLELGGKNALIAFPDADPDEVAAAAVAGMNFTWCGQSCGSTSRAFVHESIHDAVVARIKQRCAAYEPGVPTDPKTTMGAIISKTQCERVLDYIAIGRAEGASVVYGGGRPAATELAGGNFVEPTVFVGVEQHMRIASEEIFGPVLAVLRWSDEAAMLADVNRVDYGLTCSIWTRDLDTAHRTAQAVEAGYILRRTTSALRSAATNSPASVARSAWKSCSRTRKSRTSILSSRPNHNNRTAGLNRPGHRRPLALEPRRSPARFS
jgi:betaine-aldehyde dehydrogenase